MEKKTKMDKPNVEDSWRGSYDEIMVFRPNDDTSNANKEGSIFYLKPLNSYQLSIQDKLTSVTSEDDFVCLNWNKTVFLWFVKKGNRFIQGNIWAVANQMLLFNLI